MAPDRLTAEIAELDKCLPSRKEEPPCPAIPLGSQADTDAADDDSSDRDEDDSDPERTKPMRIPFLPQI